MTNTASKGFNNWFARIAVPAVICFSASFGTWVHAQAITEAPAAKVGKAAEKPQVAVRLEQFKVQRNEKGEEQFQSADFVKPGDVIEYRLTYHNKGQTAAKDLSINLPVPDGAVYMARSASPQGVQAATKDGRFDAEPLKRVVVAADGKSKVEPVPYGEYRAIRWKVAELPAGKEATAKARIQIESLKSAEEISKEALRNSALVTPSPKQ
ncbi:hypothetical protein [Rhodoferax sp. GW822-FHT02A01]|uniref:hypothetical protein n=1 Tax=Rhodoferax sp. GW822-FHT02A01 TaxID=3141537 RepID=UPI00315CD4E4